MAYVDPNFLTKKAFLAAVKSGEKLMVYSPGPFPVTQHGDLAYSTTVEGPHYPQPHRWYSSVVVEHGIVVSAK